MRKLDIERMRRYPARTTPDTIVRTFDTLSDGCDTEIAEWLEDFKRKMWLKHGAGYVRFWQDFEPDTNGVKMTAAAFALNRLNGGLKNA